MGRSMPSHQAKSRSKARAAARLAAGQALYQHEMEAVSIPALLHEFHNHRLGATIEDVEYAEADIAFFDDIVTGVSERRDEIDRIIAGKLTADWTLDRLDKPMRQILRAGTYELMARKDVPVGAAISEYLDVTDAFYDRREKGFVNGILDAVAKEVRG
jgi:N utilization substance protein B